MPHLFQDLRHALRRLRLSPGFTAVAILIMGLGIGSNTAMFSIVSSFLFRPIPFENPDEVVRIYTDIQGEKVVRMVSYPDFLDFRERTDLFSGTAATSDMDFFNLATEGGSETVLGEFYTSDFFSALGISPVLGRGFLPEEDGHGMGEPTVLVSFAEWQRRYDGASDILGRTVRINGLPLTVVGVTPKDFKGMVPGLAAEYFLPLGAMQSLRPEQAETLTNRQAHEFQVTARLQPGVTLQQVRSRLDALVVHRSRTDMSSNETERSVRVLLAKDVIVMPGVDKALLPLAGFLMIIVGLVLLVACSNLGNLLLMRAAARQKEVAVRLALGAGRARLIGQLLVESLLLGLAGGLVGLLFARLTVGLIISFRPPVPVAFSIDHQLDPRVLAFTLGLSIVTGIVFGLVPALKASRPDLVGQLKDEVTSLGDDRRFSLKNALVVAQVAISMLLLIGAGLFVRSIGNQQQVDPGFAADQTALATLDLELGGISEEEQGRAFFERFRQRIAATPGVESVALASRAPLGIFGSNRRPVYPADMKLGGDELPPVVMYSRVSDDYFEALEIPMVKGRGFSAADVRGAAPVVVVSEAFAREFWDSPHVLGETLYLGALGEGTPARVIGVARDTKVRSLREEPQPYLYVPFAQEYSATMTLIARTSGDPSSLPEVFRRELRDLDRDLPLLTVQTMTEHLGVMLWGPRMTASLLTGFGLLAMALASLGLYGIVAFSVAQRTREIGIRVALGASKAQVVQLILRRAMALVALGIFVGTAFASLAMRPLSKLLLEVSPTDPMTFLVVAFLLAIVSLCAGFLPAHRAAAADPMVALRSE